MSSRRYIKRVWRVPKDRGALDYFAALVVKALVKHGWPVRYEPDPITEGFVLHHVQGGETLPPDLQAAAQIAVRIVARTYRLDVSQHSGWVGFNRAYVVTSGGHFKEVKHDPTGQG